MVLGFQNRTAKCGLMTGLHRHRYEQQQGDQESNSISGKLWTDGTIELAARLITPSKSLVGQTKFITRILHVKHWHGRSKGKSKESTKGDTLYPLCRDQDSVGICIQYREVLCVVVV